MPQDFDLKGAREAGYSSKEIDEYLRRINRRPRASLAAPVAKMPPKEAEEAFQAAKRPITPSFVTDPFKGGAEQVRGGLQKLWEPSDTTAADPQWWDTKAAGVSDVIRGSSPFLMAAGGPAFAAAPAAAALPTIAGLLGGTMAQGGVERLAEGANVSPGMAGLMGDVAGFAGGSLAGIGASRLQFPTGAELHQSLQAAADAALERIRSRGSYTGEMANALPLPDMKDMVVWAASKIGQGIVNPAALRREIVGQFKGVPREAVQAVAEHARNLALKHVKPWAPGMALDDIHPLTPDTIPIAGKAIQKEDIIRYLNDQAVKKVGRIELDAPDRVKLNRILKLGRGELTEQLAMPAPKTDFYLVDTPQADADMIQMFPELRTEPHKMTLAKAASAALAQGSNPEAEAMNGGRAYAYYRRHGRLPFVQPDDGVPGQTPGKQWSTTGGSDPIIKLQGFIDSFKTKQDPTGLLGLERILTGKFPVQYLKLFNPNIEGKAGELAHGALILGPKIGSYFLDIAGIPQKGATVDMWDSLAQYRRLANMFAPNGKPFTSPRQPDRPIFMDFHRMLENEFGLMRTESQSGLWHYEKDLYRRLGAPTLVKGRSDGTQRLLDAWGGNQRQNVITKQNAPPPPSRETYTPPQIP
ncbi:MAG TPA: hypothetical protein VFI76_09840 [Terrimicrobiaceae bacterium]|nr:hypothetical protein [Terrimicrobiaceae bacterium]